MKLLHRHFFGESEGLGGGGVKGEVLLLECFSREEDNLLESVGHLLVVEDGVGVDVDEDEGSGHIFVLQALEAGHAGDVAVHEGAHDVLQVVLVLFYGRDHGQGEVEDKGVHFIGVTVQEQVLLPDERVDHAQQKAGADRRLRLLEGDEHDRLLAKHQSEDEEHFLEGKG